MARRPEDDFDDEEYLPPDRRDERPRRFPVVIVGLLVGAAVVGAGLYFVGANRRAAEQIRRVTAERETAAAVIERQKRLAAADKPRSNWEKAIGTWVREPGPQDQGGSPYRFEFRNDLTALTVRTNFDGQPQQREGRVEVLADHGTRLMLRMEVPGGTISYTFRFKPDATLVLDSGEGELAFTRPK